MRREKSMINKTLRSSVCIFAIAAAGIGSALAADIYTPPPAAGGYKDGPVYEPVTSWTGFYVGINGGYGWNAKRGEATANAFDTDIFDTTPLPQRPIGFAAAGAETFISSSRASLDSNGGFGGGQIGYNLQRGHLVFGIESDLQGSGIGGNARTTTIQTDVQNAPDVVTSVSAHSSLDWFGTVRGRLGYAFDRTLIYGTGGFAFGGVSDRLTSSVEFNSTGTSSPASAKSDATRTGYVLGGGLEYALTPAWSLKAEYQYLNLGTSSLSTATVQNDSSDPFGGPETGSGTLKVDHTYHTVRAGLNYHILPAYEPLK
jgi:outer membrane immunogenic protein